MVNTSLKNTGVQHHALFHSFFPQRVVPASKEGKSARVRISSEAGSKLSPALQRLVELLEANPDLAHSLHEEFKHDKEGLTEQLETLFWQPALAHSGRASAYDHR